MKFMVTGGNRGLGLALCQHFGADSFSRSNGYDIIRDHHLLADISLDYDVFVNNAFDGPFQEDWGDFGQVRMLYEVAQLWRDQGKTGHIINIGSTGGEDIVVPEPTWETYRVSKVALKYHSQQWTRAFRNNLVPFRTSLLTIDRLDTELSRSRPTWTGNGINLDEIMGYVELILASRPNTCIEEIHTVVNLNHKHTSDDQS